MSGAGDTEKGEITRCIKGAVFTLDLDLYQRSGAAAMNYLCRGDHDTMLSGADKMDHSIQRNILSSVCTAGGTGGTVGQRIIGAAVEFSVGVTVIVAHGKLCFRFALSKTY